MPEDTARRLAEIREAFDCSVADYGMDPGDTGFLLDHIGALTKERDALRDRVLLAFPLLAAHFEHLVMDDDADQAVANEAWELVRSLLDNSPSSVEGDGS